MKTAALLWTFLVTVCTGGEASDVAHDKCCFPPNYAWLERKYSSYSAADRRGAISQPVIRESEVLVVSDGERLYKYETIRNFGSLRFNLPAAGVALTFTELNDCYSVSFFDFNVVGDRCSKLPFVGTERRHGLEYYVYRLKQSGATSRFNELLATHDKDGNCIPRFEHQSSSNARMMYAANLTYEVRDFGEDEQALLEVPTASEFCKEADFERLKQSLSDA